MSWPKVKLGALCDTKSGGTPRRGNSEYYSGEIPWVKIGDLDAQNGVILDTDEKITEAGLASIGNRIFEKGTILLSMYGSVGKVAIAGRKLAINQAILGLKIKDEKLLNPRYFVHWLRTIQKELTHSARGGTLQNINQKMVRDVDVPLPPIEEQIRIADILDKADEIKKNCAKTSEIRDEIIRSTFLDIFGDLNINPKGWKLVLLNDLVDKLGDGIHGTPVYDENGDYFFINGTNLRDKKIKILENTKRVNELEYLKHKKDLNASTMFVSINGTVGNVAYYNGEPVMLGKSVCYFNVKESEVSKTYLYYLIKNNYFTNYARGNSTGSTIRNLSLKAMRNFPIPLPPINIQNEFEILIQNISEMGINLSIQNTELLSESITQSLIG